MSGLSIPIHTVNDWILVASKRYLQLFESTQAFDFESLVVLMPGEAKGILAPSHPLLGGSIH
jgi:hypothetical protein